MKPCVYIFYFHLVIHILFAPGISLGNPDPTENSKNTPKISDEAPLNPFADKKIILIGNSIHVHISLGRYTTELTGSEKDVQALVEYYDKNTGRLLKYIVARQDILAVTSNDPHSSLQAEYFLHYRNGSGLIKFNMLFVKTKHNLFSPSIRSVYLKDSEHRIVFIPDEIRFAKEQPSDIILETAGNDEKEAPEHTIRSRSIHSREIRISFSRFTRLPFLNISQGENERLAHIEVFDGAGYIESHPSVYNIAHEGNITVYEIRNEYYVYKIRRSRSGEMSAFRSSHSGINKQNLKVQSVCNHHLKDLHEL